MQTVDLDGYESVDFPDSASPEQIEQAIASMISSGQLTPISQEQTQPQQQMQGTQQEGGRIVPSLGWNQGEEPQGQVQQPEQEQQQTPEMGALASFLQQAAQNPVSQFALGTGDQFNNAFRNIGNMILPESMQAPQTQHGQGRAYEAGKFLGDVGAFAATGGALKGALTAAESLPMLGNLAAKIGGAATPGVSGAPLSAVGPSAISTALGGTHGVARRAAGGGLYGASQAEDNRLAGAGEMAASSAIMDALGGGVSKLFPRNYLAHGYPPQQLLENLAVSKGYETPLGNIVGSPKLQHLSENILPELPFSGGEQTRARIQNKIEKEGMSMVDRLRHNVPPENISNALVKELKLTDIAETKFKKEAYDVANETARKEGFTVVPEGLSNVIKKYGAEIDSNDFLPYFPAERNIIRMLSHLSESIRRPTRISLKGVMSDVKNLSLEEANTQAAKIIELGRKKSLVPSASARNESEALLEIGYALKNDVKNQVNRSGFDDLIQQFNFAEKNYGENYAPFLEKQIHQFTSGKVAPSEITSSFIKTGRDSDKSELVTKIMDRLTPKGKDLLKYSYLARAIENGKLNALQMKNLLSKQSLGENQMTALFNKPGELKAMKDYGQLATLSSDAISRMFNPKTGAREMHLLPYGVMGTIATIASLMGGSIPAMAAAGGAVFGGGNILNKILSSEKVRTKVVNAIVKDIEQPRGHEFKRTKEILTPLLGRTMRETMNKKEEMN